MQIVCDGVGGKRKSTQLEIEANATCSNVIRQAMQSFGIIYTQHPHDYSLIQIDRLTKGAGLIVIIIVIYLFKQNSTNVDNV